MRKHILIGLAIILITMSVLTLLSTRDIQKTNQEIIKENNTWLALTVETDDDEANYAASLFKMLMSNDEDVELWERHTAMVNLAELNNGYYFKEYSFYEAIGVMTGEREVDRYISPLISLMRDLKFNLIVSFSFGGIYLFLVVTKMIFFKENKKRVK